MGTHVIDVGAPTLFFVAWPEEAITISALAPTPYPQISAGDGSLKKQPMHHSGLPHVTPPLPIVEARHNNYSGADNMFVDMPTRYETQTFPIIVVKLV
jgi:hypothetical protein